jgi:26S proteasome regulatory subunit T5
MSEPATLESLASLPQEEDLDQEILRSSTDEIQNRIRLLENDIKIMKSEALRINHEHLAQKDKIKDNLEKIKLNKQLPYLVANVVEILDMDPDAGEEGEEGANVNQDDSRKKCAVIKTSTRQVLPLIYTQTIFLPMIGLVDPDKLRPADLVGVNKDSYLILDMLPAEYDSRVKAMEVDEKPTEDYNDIGGLDKQIEELVEAIVLPMTHHERFVNLGIKPPKGCLMYGPVCVLFLISAWNGKDVVGESVCGTDKLHIPEACRPAARADVYW